MHKFFTYRGVLSVAVLLLLISGGIALVTIQGFFSDTEEHHQQEVSLVYQSPQDADDICSIEDSLVIPYAYRNTVSLRDLNVEERKKKFIDMLLPAFLIAKHRMLLKRERAKEIRDRIVAQKTVPEEDSVFFIGLFEQYKAGSWPELERKLTPHPVSIAIAQAAVESGWGTSRFFIHANNFTGIWSYNRNEARIRASGQRSGKAIYLRAYADLIEGAMDYYQTLARVSAYSSFRKARMKTDDPYLLVAHLTPYSELREEYTRRLATIIRYNQLTRYDEYQLHPAFLKGRPSSTQDDADLWITRAVSWMNGVLS